MRCPRIMPPDAPAEPRRIPNAARQIDDGEPVPIETNHGKPASYASCRSGAARSEGPARAIIADEGTDFRVNRATNRGASGGVAAANPPQVVRRPARPASRNRTPPARPVRAIGLHPVAGLGDVGDVPGLDPPEHVAARCVGLEPLMPAPEERAVHGLVDVVPEVLRRLPDREGGDQARVFRESGQPMAAPFPPPRRCARRSRGCARRWR
jgi:hypothetical protein